LIYVILGSAMEELSMILLTVPVFFPVITALGFDALWFGILVVIVVQIGMISPPVGMNIFVVKNLLGNVSIATMFRGVLPFNIALIALLAIMLAFPILATYLPGLMK
jgi:TRAP-type C4-dicarboxylate transport system permease large subunit